MSRMATHQLNRALFPRKGFIIAKPFHLTFEVAKIKTCSLPYSICLFVIFLISSDASSLSLFIHSLKFVLFPVAGRKFYSFFTFYTENKTKPKKIVSIEFEMVDEVSV